MKKKIIFDTETTGLLKPRAAPLEVQPYITEIYAVKIDEEFQILDELNTYVRIPVPVSKKITQITGITDEDLKDAPTFLKLTQEIAEFFADSTEMIAHNLPFDKSMLQYQFDRAKKTIVFPIKQTCTIQKSMCLEGRRLSLSNLHQKMTGKPLINAHRAKNDVHGLVRVYHKMLERGLCD